MIENTLWLWKSKCIWGKPKWASVFKTAGSFLFGKNYKKNYREVRRSLFLSSDINTWIGWPLSYVNKRQSSKLEMGTKADTLCWLTWGFVVNDHVCTVLVLKVILRSFWGVCEAKTHFIIVLGQHLSLAHSSSCKHTFKFSQNFMMWNNETDCRSR